MWLSVCRFQSLEVVRILRFTVRRFSRRVRADFQCVVFVCPFLCIRFFAIYVHGSLYSPSLVFFNSLLGLFRFGMCRIDVFSVPNGLVNLPLSVLSLA